MYMVVYIAYIRLYVQYMSELDSINTRILQILEGDGRISNTDLAARVGLSPSACLRRVQDLERRRIIEGYRAIINHKKLGTNVTAFVMVGLSGHLKSHSLAFETAMAAASEVRECHNVTGAVEYLLRVEVADLDAYKRFHGDVLGTLAQVSSITSYISLASPKDMRG